MGPSWAGSTARLADFQPLLPAETEIIRHLSSGRFDRLGDGSLPKEEDPGRVVRASFLRFLMLGGDEDCRPHEKGIRVSGAWIRGVLDLEACRVPNDIGLNNCHFEAAPVLRTAIINRLFLNGSRFPGIEAERLDARAGVYFRGARVDGTVIVAQSRLGGNLECDGMVVDAPEQAIDAEGIEVRSVIIRRARLTGAINLSGARLEADLDCDGSTVSRPAGLETAAADWVAIDLYKIESRGSVTIRNAEIDGEIRLVASYIHGDLDFTDTILSNPGHSAVDMSRALIKGAFFLRGSARVDGALAMTGASIDTIHDSAACWPKHGDLLLNRCLYGAFIGGPVDAQSRLDWLSRQTPQRWGEDFWPQPYEQLGQVFRQMGHLEDSSTVLIVKERLQRRARRARTRNPLWRAYLGVQDAFLKVTVAYGRQPLLALAWMALFWAVGVGVFWNAERLGAFKPNSAVVLRSPEWTLCGVGTSEQRFLVGSQSTVSGLAAPGQTQLACFLNRFEASSYPEFNPWMYSLDTLLPVLEMGQKDYWRPNPPEPGGAFAIAYFYFQSVVGWALSLLAVAGFSGLVKSP